MLFESSYALATSTNVVGCFLVAYLLLILWWWDAPLRGKLFVRRLFDKTTPRLPPGGFGFPFLGHLPWILLQYLRDPGSDLLGDYHMWNHERYGEIHCGSLPPIAMRFVGVNSEEFVQFILSKENRGVVGEVDQATRDVFGRSSLISLNGSFHKRMRSAILPVFQTAFLSQYVDRMNDIVKDYLSHNWLSRSGPKRLVIQDEMKHMTFEIICDLILGIDIEKDRETVKRMVELFQVTFKGIFMPTFWFPGNPYHQAMKARAEIDKILLETIQRRRSEKVERNDVLQLLVNPIKLNGGEMCNLTDDEIVDNLVVLLFAGSDTSTVTMSWIIKKLTEHPNILSKLREEHVALHKGRNGNKSPRITWEEIESLPYTNQVIFETLRSEVPVRSAFRRVTEDLEYKGYLFPKGYKVWLQLGTMTKTTFQDCGFNPERFDSDQPLGALKTAGFKPFGGGVRMCIGYRLAIAEMHVFLHHMLLNYDFEAVPDESGRQTHFPLPLPAGGLPVDVFTL